MSPYIDWNVMGTHPCAGHYSTLKDFQVATLERLSKMKELGIKSMARNVIGSGDQEWATIELVAKAVCKNDESFSSPGMLSGIAD